jgi:hypothetical protein
VGGLSSDDLYSSATAVFHFKNDSDETLNINLESLNILNAEENIKLPEIILSPGDKFSTKEIKTRVSTYSTDFNLKLTYDINGVRKLQNFRLTRQTPADFKNRS